MEKAIVPIFDVCSGCRICEIACSISHFDRINPTKSRITIVKRGLANDLAVVCNQGLKCSEECVDSCPVDAIKNENDILKIIKDECTGCEACVEACPYNAIKMVEEIAIKCDLCDGNPNCVKFCPLNAIKYDSDPKKNFDDVRNLIVTAGKEVG